MKILVQKFGGTSVATPESREKVYEKILAAKKNGYSLVVVISAMGRSGAPYATDTLLDLIRLDYPKVQKRELDHIFICGEIISGTIITANLQKRGHLASHLTGKQAGIITTNEHTDARILRIEKEKIYSFLNQGHIVVVAGGQGETADGEITTLGRGGSDTTACALGVALNAEAIEIYTDVEGIMSADPRIISNAQILKEISYDCCCEMAKQGAKVIHPRAVEIASQNPNTKLYIRSTFSDSSGTLISNNYNRIHMGADILGEEYPIGVAVLDKQTIFKVGVLSQGQKLDILEKLQNIRCSVNEIHPEEWEMILIAEENEVEVLEEFFKTYNLNAEKIEGLAKVSMIGTNLLRSQEYLIPILAALKSNSITVAAKLVQHNVISVWISSEAVTKGMETLHKLIEQKDKDDMDIADNMEVTA